MPSKCFASRLKQLDTEGGLRSQGKDFPMFACCSLEYVRVLRAPVSLCCSTAYSFCVLFSSFFGLAEL